MNVSRETKALFALKHHRLVLAMAVASLSATGAIAAQIEQASPWAVTNNHAFHDKAATFERYAADQEPISIVVTLKLQNQDLLDSYTKDLFRPNSLSYHQWMTSDQATEYFSPTKEQAQAVADYLTKMGFTNVTISKSRLLVLANGTIETAKHAFNTDIGHFSKTGIHGIANTRDIQIPAALGSQVERVLGLNTMNHRHTLSLPMPSREQTAVINPDKGSAPGGIIYYKPEEFASIYQAGSLAAATKTTAAIIGYGEDMTEDVKNLQKYESDAHLKPTPTEVVSVGTQPSEPGGDGEWSMDAQAIVGISGGLQKLIFYTSDGSDDAVARSIDLAVSDNKARVLNMSWGDNNCEADDDSVGSLDNLFHKAVLQGQTFSASSGDSGALQCGALTNGAYGTAVGIGYPASSPYVVAVGGTTLHTEANDAYVSETAWPFSGGGVSVKEAKPFWQANLPGNFRSIPDVAFDADYPNSAIRYYLDGGYTYNGGTSLSSPLFVGAWARLESAQGNKLGFAAPGIYAYAKSLPLNDITFGSNGYYPAAAGWDYPTGWGSFNIESMNFFIKNNPGFADATHSR